MLSTLLINVTIMSVVDYDTHQKKDELPFIFADRYNIEGQVIALGPIHNVSSV